MYSNIQPPSKYSLLAQLVERVTVNHDVIGSSPIQGAIYSRLAQSVERMTVNHDVTGSSPVTRAQ